MKLIPEGVDDATQKTDTIVVLTGGSLRLQTGLTLLKEGRADKLFVSGVHLGVDVRQLLRLARTSPSEAECCIQLGHAADDTAGNAAETQQWMAAQKFQTLRLVTAAYHMPRSLVEFSHAMPDARIVVHPVFPPQVKLQEWWRWRGTAFLILGEYSKYLIARTRHIFERLIE
ncbi:MAG: YdcF family protein [Pseudomonadota bacterium]|nr:YdcF family protein [Pseudomonadota bacterium]